MGLTQTKLLCVPDQSGSVGVGSSLSTLLRFSTIKTHLKSRPFSQLPLPIHRGSRERKLNDTSFVFIDSKLSNLLYFGCF
ncbi:hypothetical protein L1887_38542 [Cichorium endivia]|nr:hypothetical protein L1887_38542 [Cichorium endivia]